MKLEMLLALGFVWLAFGRRFQQCPLYGDPSFGDLLRLGSHMSENPESERWRLAKLWGFTGCRFPTKNRIDWKLGFGTTEPQPDVLQARERDDVRTNHKQSKGVGSRYLAGESI